MRNLRTAAVLFGVFVAGVASAESSGAGSAAAPAPSAGGSVSPSTVNPTAAGSPSGSAAPEAPATTAEAASAEPPASTAAAASAEASAPSGEAETAYDALPENPRLKEADLAEEAPASAPQRAPRVRRLELGAALGAAFRGSSTSEIDVSPGPVGSIHGRVLLLDWLGLVIRGGAELHSVDIAQSAFGFEGLDADQESMRVISLGAQADARLRLSSQWYLHAGLGLGWSRLVAGEMNATEPVEFGLGSRTGVLLDVTLSPRVSYHFSERLGVSLWGHAAVPLLQSGDVFASGPSELQTVRRDNGQLLSVGGFPDLTHGLSTQLSVDVFF